MRFARVTPWLIASAAVASPVLAQEARPPTRYRVMIGPQLVPSYPGSDRVVFRPIGNLDRARGDTPFIFEAPDEAAGFALWSRKGLSIGPAANIEGRRRARDVGTALPDVGWTVEAGGFVQYQLTPTLRARAELRQGLGGHGGLIGVAGLDYVVRDRDRWLVSIGPRLTFSNGRYQRAYFGVAPGDAPAAGLPAFEPDGGLHAAGATGSIIRQLTKRWGVFGFVRYDRLLGGPGASPVTRGFGARDQLSGGAALTYSFTR